MSTSASLHKSLRKVPDFRLLSEQELEAVVSRMTFREYKTGEVLWHTGTRFNFLGIVHRGEIMLERQVNGKVVRFVTLSAGAVVPPRYFKRGEDQSSMVARAVTSVRFGLLQLDQPGFKSTRHLKSRRRPHPFRHLASYMVWAIIVFTTIMIVSWRDLSRIFSGLLYFSANPANQSVLDQQRSVWLLNYAKRIDQGGASFAYNQEGLIWYQLQDLQDAEASFARAVNIERKSGVGLNNLAVTYFRSGQVQQAVTNQKEAAQNAPNNAVVRYNLGIVWMVQKSYLQAIHEFREATLIDPAWALPYLQLSFTYLQIQDYANAEKAAATASILDPAQQSAYVIRSITLHKQNRDPEALSAIENALRSDPADHIALFYKAHILNELGQFEAALSIFDKLRGSMHDPEQLARISAEIEAIHRIQASRQVSAP